MHYEEDLINGALMFRNGPSAEWHPCSNATVTMRLQTAVDKIKALYTALDEVGSLLSMNEDESSIHALGVIERAISS